MNRRKAIVSRIVSSANNSLDNSLTDLTNHSLTDINLTNHSLDDLNIVDEGSEAEEKF